MGDSLQFDTLWIVDLSNQLDFVFAISRDYKEYHTDTTVRFVIKMTPEKLAQAEEQGLHKVFKLQNAVNLTNLVSYV